MKNLHTKLFTVIMLCSFGAFSQSGTTNIPSKILHRNNTNSKVKAVKHENPKDFDDPIFTSDFSDPSDWVIGNYLGNNDDWVISTDEPLYFYGIASTTAANGFAVFDSYSLCSGNQNAWIRNANPIDLSSEPNVSIRFETYYIAWLGACYIETSTDGTNWSNSVQILDIGSEAETSNPQIFQLPLMGIGGSSTAYFRLRYEGGCDYVWMVDDLTIAATPDYDLSISEVYYDDWKLISQSISNSPTVAQDVALVSSYEYSSYQKDEVRPLTFVANISNLGVFNLTEVTLNVTITAPDGSTQLVSSTGDLTLAANQSNTISIADVSPAAFDLSGTNPQIGDYSVDFNISAAEDDSNLSNNDAPQKTFKVDDEIMANDRNASYFGAYINYGQNVIWGNRMTFKQARQVNYIQFALLNTSYAHTLPGEAIYLNLRSGSVFSLLENNDMELAFGEQEVEYITEESELTTDDNFVWITQFFPDDETITLDAGRVHQPEIYVPASGAPYLFVAVTDGQEDFAGTLYDFSEASGGPQGWYHLYEFVPLIRLGYSTNVGVDGPTDLDFKVSQNYPNPTMGQTQIDWELMKPAKNVFLSITDQTGKVVYRQDLGDRPAGLQEPLVLNLNLAAGIYQYGLQIDNQRIVRKMTVLK